MDEVLNSAQPVGLKRDQFDKALNSVLNIENESEPIQAFHDAAMGVIFADGVATKEECNEYWEELKMLVPTLRASNPF